MRGAEAEADGTEVELPKRRALSFKKIGTTLSSGFRRQRPSDAPAASGARLVRSLSAERRRSRKPSTEPAEPAPPHALPTHTAGVPASIPWAPQSGASFLPAPPDELGAVSERTSGSWAHAAPSAAPTAPTPPPKAPPIALPAAPDDSDDSKDDLPSSPEESSRVVVHTPPPTPPPPLPRTELDLAARVLSRAAREPSRFVPLLADAWADADLPADALPAALVAICHEVHLRQAQAGQAARKASERDLW